MDAASVLRCEPAEIEQLDRDAGRGSKYLAGDFDVAIRLRHFTRTGALTAGRTVDQQNGWSAAVGVAATSPSPPARATVFALYYHRGKFIAGSCLRVP
jgi:hypothetical protein